MYDTNRPFPRRIPYPNTTVRPLTAPIARGKAGASARAEANRLRTQLRQHILIRRAVEAGTALLVLGATALLLVQHGSTATAVKASIAFLLGTTVYENLDRRRDTRKAREADRWEQGARGEENTAKLLQPLLAEGWHILHDRGLPNSAANIDHLLIPPDGRSVIVLDTKSWQRRQAPVTATGGTLYYGAQNQARTLETVRWEADRVHAALNIDTNPVIVVHGTRVDHSPLHVGDVTITSAEALLVWLRTFTAGYKGAGQADPAKAKQLADRAAIRLPAR